MWVYIPVREILGFLCIYGIIGFVLFPFLAIWQDRFLSGYQRRLRYFRTQTWPVVIKGALITAFAWPIVLSFNIKTEMRLRRKGIL